AKAPPKRSRTVARGPRSARRCPSKLGPCATCSTACSTSSRAAGPSCSRTNRVPPPERSKGQVVAGRFRLVDQVGRGGMGSVWTAHHLTLKVDVAVKFMDGAFLIGDDTLLKRFQKEATAAASIQSPNVVRILDFGKDEAGRPYLAMELLHGEELEQRLERE